MAPSDSSLEISFEKQVIAGRYQIISQLGQGGMGTVYLVRHVNTHEHLAMKVLRKELVGNAEAVERFKREMKASALLKSDNVTRITDADTAAELDGSLYMVMELLDGVDIEKLTRGKRALDPVSVIFILGEAARAIHKAHALKIIHRDLKPENLFLHRSAELGLVVKVLDFGIAMFQGPVGETQMRLTQDQSVLGTPLYMSPEQILGNREEIAPQTDIWAMGMIAYDMLVGDCYWHVPNLAVLVSNIALMKQPPPTTQAPTLPKSFDAWFAKSCAYSVAGRFGSVFEQVEALAVVLGVEPSWLDATFPPQGLLERVNEASPPKDDAVRSRSHSALRTSRTKTARLTTRQKSSDEAQPEKRRKYLLLALLLLLLSVGGAVWYRGRLSGALPAQEVTAANKPNSQAVPTTPTVAPTGTPPGPDKTAAKPAAQEETDPSKGKGLRTRMRQKTVRPVDARKGAADYDPVAP